MTMGGCSSKYAHLCIHQCVDASAEFLPILRCLAPHVNLSPISVATITVCIMLGMHQTQMDTLSIGLHEMKLSVCKPVTDLA